MTLVDFLGTILAANWKFPLKSPVLLFQRSKFAGFSGFGPNTKKTKIRPKGAKDLHFF